jgi:hypothetical protein
LRSPWSLVQIQSLLVYIIGGFRKLKRKKKQLKAPKKSPDFSLEDILKAPKPKAASKRADGLGCNNCGSLKFISKGEVKVFRGHRMKVYHCYGCGQDFYKAE